MENNNLGNQRNSLIEQLENKLRANAKTIDMLTHRVEELTLARGPALPVLEQNALLEQTLNRRTKELKQQHAELAATLNELKLAQSQLLHSQKLEAIGSLAAGIAHEINTPTQFISDNTSFLRKSFAKLLPLLESYTMLLKDAEGGHIEQERIAEEQLKIKRAKLSFLVTEIPKALDGATEGLSRISSIVQAMKEFSHPSNGLRQPIDLKDLIHTTATVARNEWKYVADLETEFDPELPPVPCLRDELGQVLVNLIVNAAHAIGAVTDGGAQGKGVIRIETRKNGEFGEIIVSDTGCGIPEPIQHRIFEPFFTTKPVGTGTGQGLPIAYSVIVDKHAGSISFDSTPGKGTTFHILLPLTTTTDSPSLTSQASSP